MIATRINDEQVMLTNADGESLVINSKRRLVRNVPDPKEEPLPLPVYNFAKPKGPTQNVPDENEKEEAPLPWHRTPEFPEDEPEEAIVVDNADPSEEPLPLPNWDGKFKSE